MPTLSELGMVKSESEAFGIRALEEVESQEMVEADVEDSVVDASNFTLATLPSNQRMG